MIKLVYCIDKSEKDAEIEWLRDQKVFAAYEDFWDWKKNITVVRIGAIVGKEAALAIKLRHKLDLQTEYKQR